MDWTKKRRQKLRIVELPNEAIQAIVSCLERGSDAEVKRVGATIQVIEIKRKLKIKTPVTGQSDANRGE